MGSYPHTKKLLITGSVDPLLKSAFGGNRTHINGFGTRYSIR
jgi:hypothetical protein